MFVNKTKMWNNFDFSSDCEYISVNLYVCLVKFRYVNDGAFQQKSFVLIQ